MSLRTRLFLLFGGLIVVLLGAQWWMWQSLIGKLDKELETVAFEVGQGVISFFAADDGGDVKVLPAGNWVSDDVKVELTGEAKRRHKIIEAEIEESQRVVHEYHTTYKIIHQNGKRKRIKIPTEAVVDTDEEVEDIIIQQFNSDGDATIDIEADPSLGVRVLIVNGEQIHPRPGEPVTTDMAPDFETRNLFLRLQDDDLLLGDEAAMVKRIPIPKSGISERLATARKNYLLGSMGILGLGLLLAAMAAHRFTQPLRSLASAAREVGRGNLGRQIYTSNQVGEVGVAIGAFNSMSLRLKELNAETEAMRRREYLSELGEIANGLAHTIRNPLNTLGLSVEQLALQGSGDEASAELAATARGQIRRIDQWIRSFLALASQGVAREEPIHFRTLIEDVVLEAMQSASKAVELDLDLAEQKSVCHGVVPEMRAVLQALIINAVDASPEEATVSVTLSEDAENLCIDVADRGPGVDKAVRDKLFTPHVTTKENGSGMGLFLAGRIISSRYGGSVELLNREGGGTTARVIIPIQKDVAGGDRHE